jgi:hypothetical protein
MKPGTNKNGRLEYKALFVVIQILVLKYKYRQLLTMIHFMVTIWPVKANIIVVSKSSLSLIS